jgi:hypothetical protein
MKKNKSKKSDNRDTIPFEIYKENDMKSKMGCYLLDSSTACGDLVDLGIKGIYSVKKVTYVYRYQHGSLRVCKKKLVLTNSPERSSFLHTDHLDNKYMQ